MTSQKVIPAITFLTLLILLVIVGYAVTVTGDELARTTRFLIRTAGIILAAAMVFFLMRLVI